MVPPPLMGVNSLERSGNKCLAGSFCKSLLWWLDECPSCGDYSSVWLLILPFFLSGWLTVFGSKGLSRPHPWAYSEISDSRKGIASEHFDD